MTQRDRRGSRMTVSNSDGTGFTRMIGATVTNHQPQAAEVLLDALTADDDADGRAVIAAALDSAEAHGRAEVTATMLALAAEWERLDAYSIKRAADLRAALAGHR